MLIYLGKIAYSMSEMLNNVINDKGLSKQRTAN